MSQNNGLGFLDTLAIVSFVMQLQNTDLIQKQASNDDILRYLHEDVDRLEGKLDKILELLNKG